MPNLAVVAYNKPIAVEIGQKVATAWQPRTHEMTAQAKAIADWVLTGSGHGIVDALPGVGKTTLLIDLIPLICDFKTDVTAATIHSMGFQAWREANRGRRIKVSDPGYKKVRDIIDGLAAEENDHVYASSWAFLQKVVSYAKLSGFGVHGGPSIDDHDAWLDMMDLYSLNAELFNGVSEKELVTRAIRIYRESLKQCRDLIDFDDMPLVALYNNVKIPTYDWVFVDEAADLSFIRRKLAVGMLGPNSRMLAVGDKRQAINSWCGADAESLEFLADDLGNNVSTFPLTVTYRLPKLGVAMAKAYAPEFEAAPGAVEGSYRKVSLTDFWNCGPFGPDDLILCRNNRPLVELAYTFLKKKIPAYIEGKDIGAGLVKLAQKWKVVRLDALVSKLEDYREREVARLTAKKMEKKAEDLNDKVETLLVLVDTTQSNGGGTVTDLVNLINSIFGNTPEGTRPRCVVLSTVHKKKGAICKRTFILGRNRYMPSKYSQRKGAKDWEVEGEKAVIFVALTRHTEELVDIIVDADEGRKAWKR